MPQPHGDDALLAVHDADLVGFLDEAWALWVAAGYPDDPGQDDVVGYIFPHPGSRRPARAAARDVARPRASGTSRSTR